MMVSCHSCAVAGQLSRDRKSGDQEIGFKKFGTELAPESGWPSSDSSWQCYYILEI